MYYVPTLLQSATRKNGENAKNWYKNARNKEIGVKCNKKHEIRVCLIGVTIFPRFLRLLADSTLTREINCTFQLWIGTVAEE